MISKLLNRREEASRTSLSDVSGWEHVLVPQGCHNKLPQMHLETREICFLTVLEDRSLKSRCQRVGFLRTLCKRKNLMPPSQLQLAAATLVFLGKGLCNSACVFAHMASISLCFCSSSSSLPFSTRDLSLDLGHAPNPK